jgi:hypothetical protein
MGVTARGERPKFGNHQRMCYCGRRLVKSHRCAILALHVRSLAGHQDRQEETAGAELGGRRRSRCGWAPCRRLLAFAFRLGRTGSARSGVSARSQRLHKVAGDTTAAGGEDAGGRTRFGRVPRPSIEGVLCAYSLGFTGGYSNSRSLDAAWILRGRLHAPRASDSRAKGRPPSPPARSPPKCARDNALLPPPAVVLAQASPAISSCICRKLRAPDRREAPGRGCGSLPWDQVFGVDLGVASCSHRLPSRQPSLALAI